MPRPSAPLLSRDRIVLAALGLIDAQGLAAFSTRKLAAELGVAGPSLYNHFATKDAILEAVADEIIGQVDISVFETRIAAVDWAQALRLWARSYRDALASHPNALPVLSQGPGRRPHSLAMANAVNGCLIQAGWPPARATHIGAMMRFFVVGASVGSFATGFVDDPELYAAHYPHLRQAHRLAERAAKVDRDAFELGLNSLLRGLADPGDQRLVQRSDHPRSEDMSPRP
jgi:AcrR family transcriptional regulator